MMNFKIAVTLLALPLGTLPFGAFTLFSQSATAAEIIAPVAVREAPVVVAQRFDNDRRDRDRDNDRRDRNQNNDRREAAQREAARRNEQRRVWVPGHWESGFLGIGRKWVEGRWEKR